MATDWTRHSDRWSAKSIGPPSHDVEVDAYDYGYDADVHASRHRRHSIFSSDGDASSVATFPSLATIPDEAHPFQERGWRKHSPQNSLQSSLHSSQKESLHTSHRRPSDLHSQSATSMEEISLSGSYPGSQSSYPGSQSSIRLYDARPHSPADSTSWADIEASSDIIRRLSDVHLQDEMLVPSGLTGRAAGTSSSTLGSLIAALPPVPPTIAEEEEEEGEDITALYHGASPHAPVATPVDVSHYVDRTPSLSHSSSISSTRSTTTSRSFPREVPSSVAASVAHQPKTVRLTSCPTEYAASVFSADGHAIQHGTTTRPLHIQGIQEEEEEEEEKEEEEEGREEETYHRGDDRSTSETQVHRGSPMEDEVAPVDTSVEEAIYSQYSDDRNSYYPSSHGDAYIGRAEVIPIPKILEVRVSEDNAPSSQDVSARSAVAQPALSAEDHLFLHDRRELRSHLTSLLFIESIFTISLSVILLTLFPLALWALCLAPVFLLLLLAPIHILHYRGRIATLRNRPTPQFLEAAPKGSRSVPRAPARAATPSPRSLEEGSFPSIGLGPAQCDDRRPSFPSSFRDKTEAALTAIQHTYHRSSRPPPC